MTAMAMQLPSTGTTARVPEHRAGLDMADEIAHLRGLDIDGLRLLWRNRTSRRAPAHLSKHLLMRILAYAMQAEAVGDLSPASRKALERLATGAQERPDQQQTRTAPAARTLRPGTLLTREWAGSVHRVMVLEEGFAWNGATYASLSKVANAITGGRWNGPRFFGLRDRKHDGIRNRSAGERAVP